MIFLDMERLLSKKKNEPEWMTEVRVKAYHHFLERPMPDWGNEELLNSIDFDAVTYFLKSSGGTENDWDDVPEDIKNTFDRLGIPEAEQKWLGGVAHMHGLFTFSAHPHKHLSARFGTTLLKKKNLNFPGSLPKIFKFFFKRVVSNHDKTLYL